MKIFCICDNKDTQTGLRLAGIDGCVVKTTSEFSEALRAVHETGDIGILLIMENLAKEHRGSVDEMKLSNALPLIVEIPDRHGTGRGASFITDFITQTIGIKL